MTFREECALSAFYFTRKAVSRVQTVREMIPEYNANLDRLRQRRQELLQERELEPSFEKRYKLPCRVDRINRIIESTSAALHTMQEYVR